MRLAALSESPTGFGMTFAEAAAYTEVQWRERAGRVHLGLAARQVDGIKALAADQGHRCVVLNVAPANVRAANFYLRQDVVFLEQ